VCYRATAREADTFSGGNPQKRFISYIILHLYETVGRPRSRLTVKSMHTPYVLCAYNVYSDAAYAKVIIAKA